MLRRRLFLADRPGARFRRGRGVIALCAVAAGLIVMAAGLRTIAQDSGDVPPILELLRDARHVYAPAFADHRSASERVTHDALPLASFVKLAWVRANGMIDARALAVVSTLLRAAAIAGLLLLVVRRVGPAEAAILTAGAIAMLLVRGPEVAAFSGDAAWTMLVVLLSLLQLHGLTDERAGSIRRWLGAIAGLLAILAATPGLAATAALVLWHAGVWLTQPPRRRRLAGTFAVNALLLAFGLILAVVRDAHAYGAPAMPHFSSSTVFGILLWLPAIYCLGRWLGPKRDARTELLALTVLWVFLQRLLFQAFGDAGSSADLAVIANVACLALLPRDTIRARTGSLIAAGVWAMVVAGGTASPARPAANAVASAADVAALRSLLHEHSAAAAAAATSAEIREAAELFSGPELRRLLPASLRSPLALSPEAGTVPLQFLPDAAPALPARDTLPCFGTWSASGNAVTGEFISAPLATSLPEIQIRVAGTLRPPETSLVLRTAEGREIRPLTGSVVALDRWTRVNFPAPRGPFWVVARDESRSAWLAFTAPVEIATGSRLVGKLPRLWPWALAAGLLAFASAGVLTGLDAASAAAGKARAEPLVRWRPLPWLGVMAYAVFFSHHVDTTAGPNDSGGYLLSAKTLLEGNLTAAPRVLFPDTDATDITPYLPTTFHARADGRMAPEYPVGFPLQVWALGQFLPPERAVATLILLQLVLGVMFTRALARAMGLSDGWAWLAAALVGLSPVYLFQGLQPQSDGPALVWVTAAVVWAWSSRRTPWHALLAGFATALAVLIRPANVLCFVPVVICLAGSWRRFAAWAVAGLPGAAWLLWYQHLVYGNWHETGYGDVLSGFGLRFVVPTLKSYAAWLPEMFTPVVAAALVAPFLRAIPGRVRLMLSACCAAFGGFYAVYWCTWDNWYNMRFVLPAMPAAIVLALLATREGLQRFRLGAGWPLRVRTVAGAVAIVALVGWLGARISARRVLYWVDVNREHAVGARWVREHLPPDAVVFAKPATNPLMYYTDFVFVRSDHPAVRDSPAWFEQLARAGRPVYALTYHWEARGLDRAHDAHGDGNPDLPGEWERVAAVWEDDLFVWRQRPLAPRADGG